MSAAQQVPSAQSVIEAALVSTRADLNAVDENGETLLLRAATLKDKKTALELCTRLVGSGASPSARCRHERTVLIEIVRMRNFNWDIALLLRSSINDKGDGGKTALMWAVSGHGAMAQRRGNLGLVSHLLQLGASLSVQDKNGFTALGHAIKANDTNTNTEMIEYLRSEMVREQAMKTFGENYLSAFDDYGRLNIRER
ncbi:MAG TPA: ankyrin repeat domain-containing protein [Rhizomicrobium sp.]|jgi:ankyrin repeat protein|nr:ankyrin repeat domain-containing protein [Rhizomicrobium sp.]